MIRYDGRQQPCDGQRQYPPRCHNLAVVRAESRHAVVHLCASCQTQFGKRPGSARWQFTPLTGNDVLDVTPPHPVELMQRTPWILEVDGIKREDVIS